MKFVDAYAMNKQFPSTFFVPTRPQLDALTIGDWVQINPHKERFWVKLTHINNDSLRGIVDNELSDTHEHGINNDDDIQFMKCNIHKIMHASTQIINPLSE